MAAEGAAPPPTLPPRGGRVVGLPRAAIDAYDHGRAAAGHHRRRHHPGTRLDNCLLANPLIQKGYTAPRRVPPQGGRVSAATISSTLSRPPIRSDPASQRVAAGRPDLSAECAAPVWGRGTAAR
jgi:hypothetical protein